MGRPTARNAAQRETCAGARPVPSRPRSSASPPACSASAWRRLEERRQEGPWTQRCRRNTRSAERRGQAEKGGPRSERLACLLRHVLKVWGATPLSLLRHTRGRVDTIARPTANNVANDRAIRKPRARKPSLGSRTRGCAAPRLLQHRRRPPVPHRAQTWRCRTHFTTLTFPHPPAAIEAGWARPGRPMNSRGSARSALQD